MVSGSLDKSDARYFVIAREIHDRAFVYRTSDAYLYS